MIVFRLGNSVVCSGSFNKHWQPVKSISYMYIAQRSWLLFLPKEEATSSNHVMDKTRLCLRKNVRNLSFVYNLLVGVNCLVHKAKFDLNSNLLQWKSRPQRPLENVDYTSWLLVGTVSHSIQTCWLLQFLLKPLFSWLSRFRLVIRWALIPNPTA